MWEWCQRLDAWLEETELCYIVDNDDGDNGDKDYDGEDDKLKIAEIIVMMMTRC